MFDKDKRIFYLTGDIEDSNTSDLCFSLLCLLEEDDRKDKKEKDYKRETIKLYIQSYGGSIRDMWTLIDIMINSKTPIHTYCTGYAMSAAFKIFLAGHKRFITKHSILLYHQLSAWTGGKYQSIVEEMEMLTSDQEEIEEYVVSRTKLTKKRLEEIRLNKEDYYIHADEAIELGIADEIIG